MSNQTEETPFLRTCARTGQESGGKHYILRSTEGEELVSDAAFWSKAHSAAPLATQLARRVKALERQVAELTGNPVPADPDDGQAAAVKVPRPRRGSKKI